MKPGAKKDDKYDNESAEAGTLYNIQQIDRAGITPHAAIEVEIIKTADLNNYNKGEYPFERQPMLPGYIEFKAYVV